MRREKSIAVLPFVNLSPNVEDELFCDGIAEEIITCLSKIREIFVTSRTSSFHFKNQDIGITEIARQLSVKYIIEGSMRRAGNDIRITVQLLNAQDDYHYWSENYNRKFENIFQIQEEIAIEVREKFRELTGHFEIEERTNSKYRHHSIQAYEYILRAKKKASDLSEANVTLGLELIEKAIALEPENPSYYATKAVFIMALGVMGSIPIDKAVDLAEVACNLALELDPDDVEANAIKGYMIFADTGNVSEFNKYAGKVLEIQPKFALILYFKSIVASATGDYQTSMEALDLVSEVNPMSQLLAYFRCVNLMRLRHYGEAMEEADNFLRENRDHINIYNVKGLIYLRIGKPKIALAHFCKMPKGEKRVPYYGGMAMAFALLGNVKEAEHHLQLAEQHDGNLHLSYKENPAVMVNFLLGRFEHGFKAMAEDVEAGAWYLRFYRTNPFLDPILADPRAAMLTKMLVADEEKKTGENVEKYAKSGLNEEEVTYLGIKLSEIMQNEKPYLDPELNLKKLSKKLDISANNLSQVINSYKNQNFFDFVNSYRIRELISKLNDDKNKQFTILSMAMDSGFNSKSTFNASFKKLTGYTPTEYLKSVATESA